MTHSQSESVPEPVSNSMAESIPSVSNDVLPVTHKNIALSRIKYGSEGMAIDVVANLFGLSVFSYNQAVNNTIDYCMKKGTSFQALRT